MNKFNLEVTQSALDDGRVQLTVTVPATITSDIAKGAVLALAMQHKIDLSTARVGDLDRYVLEQVGESQYHAFLDDYVMTSLTPFAIGESGLEIIMDPVAASLEHLKAGAAFTFTATVRPKPRYELSSYEPVTLRLPCLAVSDEEVAQQLAALLERHAVRGADEGAEVKAGADILIAIETVRADTGEPVAPMTAERRVYTLGEGFLPAAFDEGLLGARAGEERRIRFELPGAELANGQAGPGIPVLSKVTVLQISKNVVPELTDAWVAAAMPELRTVEELRARVRAAGLNHKERQRDDAKYFLAASALAERMIGTIPDDIYEHTQVELLAALRAQCDAAGITMQEMFKQRGIPEQQFSMQVMLETRERLRQSFALDALARHLKLELEDADIDAALKRMAPGNEEQTRQEFEGTGRGYLLREAALRTKANAWLVDTAMYEYFD
ncbi:trigger factor [Desulfitobacterium sp. LBE]|uniref:trigger factor n=1 Tax=Desulfitobacterium sp. LBE TaxID=884086 RepID=UPI00119A0D15|nr:trigger factor [Desulfitobacterium sp. LBE]TWH57252.1 trigger factor [Desulfitobacterium sp. LBE]